MIVLSLGTEIVNAGAEWLKIFMEFVKIIISLQPHCLALSTVVTIVIVTLTLLCKGLLECFGPLYWGICGFAAVTCAAIDKIIAIFFGLGMILGIFPGSVDVSKLLRDIIALGRMLSAGRR